MMKSNFLNYNPKDWAHLLVRVDQGVNQGIFGEIR